MEENERENVWDNKGENHKERDEVMREILMGRMRDGRRDRLRKGMKEWGIKKRKIKAQLLTNMTHKCKQKTVP